MSRFNVYCDESCHLERDGHKVMVLGAVWCPSEEVREIGKRIREIKAENGLNPALEIKWTKVSPAGTRFYVDLVNYFFDTKSLHFRALIVPDKTLLNHEKFGQTHDEFYYKMYFVLLRAILTRNDRYRIYLDIKDTRGGDRVKKLREVLSNSIYDFSLHAIEQMQIVRSHEVEIMQLTDLLIGAISYANRESAGNAGKEAVVKRMRDRSTFALTRSTFFREAKCNIFRWDAQ